MDYDFGEREHRANTKRQVEWGWSRWGWKVQIFLKTGLQMFLNICFYGPHFRNDYNSRQNEKIDTRWIRFGREETEG